MYPNTKAECWKCKYKEGTFFHMWWQCPEVKKYWMRVQRWLSEITEHKSEFEREIFLLGIIKGKLSKVILYIIIHIITAVRIAFAQGWKKEKIPSEEDLTQKIMDCAELDKFTMELKGKDDSDYYAVWDRVENRNKS
uniref:Reverse transcriptase zinc-binding domain-containing protein n=1 Tax=Micrurus paraensis TaxID=1970185 RepID=A0A2D4K758_9SAUR